MRVSVGLAVASQALFASRLSQHAIRCCELPSDPDDAADGAGPSFTPEQMPGINEPFGFFDPLSFSKGVSKGIFRFYREAELKHGRIAMLAALGFPIGEQFHPLFGGEVDVPSYIAFQESSVQAFWPVLVLPIGAIELFTTFVSRRPLRPVEDGSDVNSVPGDLGFDPLGLRPESPEEFVEMQTKELNNGRLAMIAIAGMVGQEVATGAELF